MLPGAGEPELLAFGAGAELEKCPDLSDTALPRSTVSGAAGLSPEVIVSPIEASGRQDCGASCAGASCAQGAGEPGPAGAAGQERRIEGAVRAVDGPSARVAWACGGSHHPAGVWRAGCAGQHAVADHGRGKGEGQGGAEGVWGLKLLHTDPHDYPGFVAQLGQVMAARVRQYFATL